MQFQEIKGDCKTMQKTHVIQVSFRASIVAVHELLALLQPVQQGLVLLVLRTFTMERSWGSVRYTHDGGSRPHWHTHMDEQVGQYYRLPAEPKERMTAALLQVDDMAGHEQVCRSKTT